MIIIIYFITFINWNTCHIFRKRFEKAETEYVASKMDLHEKSELKEQLTEHLYTIIHQNEVRKARKLADLMRELEMENSEEEFTLPELPPLTSFQQWVIPLSPTGIKNILTKPVSPTTETSSVSSVVQVNNNLNKEVTVKTEPSEEGSQSKSNNCNSSSESRSKESEQKGDNSTTGSGNPEENQCDNRTISDVDKLITDDPSASTEVTKEVPTNVVDTNSIPTDPGKIKVGQTSKLLNEMKENVTKKLEQVD